MRPTIAVVIPTYRRAGDVERLLESLGKGSRLPDEVVVVNNDSTAALAMVCDYPFPVKILEIGMGLNLAGARNRGAQETDSDVCFFIDDDNRVGFQALEAMIDAFCDEDVHFVGPIIFAGDSGRIWCAGVERSRWTTRTRMLYTGLTEEKLPDLSRWLTQDMPNSFAIRLKILIENGGFDEITFPFHYDEADLVERLRVGGVVPYVLKASQVFHYGFATSGNPGAEILAGFQRHGEARIHLMVRARVYFHRRHDRGLRRASTLLVGVPAWVLVTLVLLIKRERRIRLLKSIIVAMLRGLSAGYRDHISEPPEALG